jgi:hypothetical protein
MVAAHKIAFTSKPVYLVQDFLRHIEKTGRPDTWPHLMNSKPDKSDVEVLYLNFQIPKRFELVPCPICNPNHGQYRKGHLVWCKSTGTLHAIGHCCGHKHFHADLFATRINLAKSQSRRRETESFLEANWQLPAKYVGLVEQVTPRAKVYDDVVNSIKAGIGRPVFQDLKAAAADGGTLYETIEVGQGGPRQQRSFAKLQFGSQPLQGTEIFGSGVSKPLGSRLKRSVELLELVEWPNIDVATEWLIYRSDDDLHDIKTSICEANEALSDAKLRLGSLRTFLRTPNLKLLTEWSQKVHGLEAARVHIVGRELSVWRGVERKRKITVSELVWGQGFDVPAINEVADRRLGNVV